MAGREEIAQARQTVAIIGGTGALGFGLAVRWAIAGVPIVIGSRDAGRAEEAADARDERAKEGGAADPRVEGLQNEEAASAREHGRARGPVPRAVREPQQPAQRAPAADDPDRRDRAAGGGDRRAARPAPSASGRDLPRSRRPRWRRVECRRVGAAHRQRRRAVGSHRSDGRGRADRGRRPQGQGRRGRSDRAASPACGPSTAASSRCARIIEQLTPLLISVNKRHKIKHSGIRITGLPE